jgi:hypothetical protein
MNIFSIFQNLFKMKKEKEHDAQEEIILTFYKGRDGKTISRTKEGKICLLDIPYCKENRIYIKENEDWRCAIKQDKEHCIIVQPITRVVTAKENEEIFGEKVDMLKAKFQRG